MGPGSTVPGEQLSYGRDLANVSGHAIPAVPCGNQCTALCDAMPTDNELCMVCDWSQCLIDSDLDGLLRFVCQPDH